VVSVRFSSCVAWFGSLLALVDEPVAEGDLDHGVAFGGVGAVACGCGGGDRAAGGRVGPASEGCARSPWRCARRGRCIGRGETATSEPTNSLLAVAVRNRRPDRGKAVASGVVGPRLLPSGRGPFHHRACGYGFRSGGLLGAVSGRCPGGVRAVSGWVPVTRSGSRWGPGLLFAGLRHGLGCDGLPGGVGQGTGGQGGRVAALECGRARRHRGSHVVEPGLRVGPWGSADSVGGLLAGPAAVAAAGAGGQRRAACVTPARVVVAGAPCVASRLSSRMWW